MDKESGNWLDRLLETPKKIISEFVEFTLNHSAGIIIILSLLGITLGYLIGGKSATWAIDNFDEGLAILEAGKISLAAGVFAVILKSRQFTTVFRGHISQVIFNPESYKSRSALTSQWLTFSKCMLKDILPERYSGAAQRIKDQFFNEELEYHFEDYEITYDISLVRNKIVAVNHTSKGKVVISPHATSPKMKQKIKLATEGESVSLKTFIVDSKEVPKKEWTFEECTDDPGSKEFLYPLQLNSSLKEKNLTRDIERTYEYKQDLEVEPYMYTNVDRYVKGFKVRTKVPDSYSMVFKKLGTGASKTVPSYEDGSEYTVWVLAAGEELIIPGQGYIIILSKKEQPMTQSTETV